MNSNRNFDEKKMKRFNQDIKKGTPMEWKYIEWND